VATATRIDPDVGDTGVWSLSSNPAGAFAINAQTGALTVANSLALDHETAPTLPIAIRFTDAGGLFFDRFYQITVTNRLEALTIGEPISGISGEQVTVTLQDERGLPFIGCTPSWDGPDGGTFSGATDALGKFQITFGAPGQYTLRVASGTIFDTAPVTVVAPATVPIGRVTTSTQLGGALDSSETVTVTVVDIHNRPVADASVVLVVSQSGVATAAAATTNAQGQCSIVVNYVATGSVKAWFQAVKGTSTKASTQETLFVQPVIGSGAVASIESQENNPKFDEELFPYVFDFAPLLGADETIVSVVGVTCKSTPASFDLNSQAMVIGVPVVHGKKVVQFLDSGKKGGVYVVRCTVRATRSTVTAELKLRLFAVPGSRT
jgi:hypothetical protein